MRLVVCSTEQLNSKSGWHLLCGDKFSLKQAINSARNRGHDTIYMHYERIGTANLSIPYDVVEFLTKINNYIDENGEYIVKFTHPCTSDNSPQSKQDLI